MGRSITSPDLVFYPRELGVNSLVVTATPQNSSAFGADGCNQLTLMGVYTRVAGTNLSFQLQSSMDNFTTTHIVQTETITAAGTGVFDNLTHNDDNAASHNFELNYPIVGGDAIGKTFRIGAITCTAGTTDTLSLTAIVGVTP